MLREQKPPHSENSWCRNAREQTVPPQQLWLDSLVRAAVFAQKAVFAIMMEKDFVSSQGCRD